MWKRIRAWLGETWRRLQRHPLWWLALFFISVIEDRIHGRLNALIDDYGPTFMKSVLEYVVYPFGVSINLFFLVVLGLLVHAYIEARRTKPDKDSVLDSQNEQKADNLRDAAARNRRLLAIDPLFNLPSSPPLQPLPPPAFLFGIQIKPIPLPDQRTLALLFENTSDKPIRFKVLIEKEQHWSERQKRFVSYSYSLNRIVLESERILEPDNTRSIPLATEMESKDGSYLAIRTILPNAIPITDQGIHLISLKVESKDSDRVEDLFINWIPMRTLEFIEDPRKKV